MAAKNSCCEPKISKSRKTTIMGGKY